MSSDPEEAILCEQMKFDYRGRLIPHPKSVVKLTIYRTILDCLLIKLIIYFIYMFL